MSVNVRCNLPSDVKLRDVSEVIGLLVGLPMEHRREGTTFNTSGISYGSSAIHCGFASGNDPLTSTAMITLDGDMIDGESHHEVMYHFEGDNGTRLLGPPSTAFWVAVCKGLVDFFGGELIVRDDNWEASKIPSNLDCITPLLNQRYQRISSGNETQDIYSASRDAYLWNLMKERKANVKPLTMADLAEADTVSAYDPPEILEEYYTNNNTRPLRIL